MPLAVKRLLPPGFGEVGKGSGGIGGKGGASSLLEEELYDPAINGGEENDGRDFFRLAERAVAALEVGEDVFHTGGRGVEETEPARDLWRFGDVDLGREG